jgi:hypothetical protein
MTKEGRRVAVSLKRWLACLMLSLQKQISCLTLAKTLTSLVKKPPP